MERMSSRIAAVTLTTTALLTVIIALMTLRISRMESDITVLRAQSASATDYRLMDDRYHALEARVSVISFDTKDLAMGLSTLSHRKPEVTSSDMGTFSSNLVDELQAFDARIQALEETDAKEHARKHL